MNRGELMDRARSMAEKLDKLARKGGYNLNPDSEMTLMLCEGIVVNIDRYGYANCPCRLAEGTREEDRDIICPCDYRDPDLFDYDTCYCGLYVSDDAAAGKKGVGSIPERRPPHPGYLLPTKWHVEDWKEGKKIWRCKVCGYMHAADEPPERCPACFADWDRFETSRIPAPAAAWRCKVCGYLCEADHAPGRCPVCKAKRDRFEAFAQPYEVPVWRCGECGYLSAMENPPPRCPYCSGGREAFGLFVQAGASA